MLKCCFSMVMIVILLDGLFMITLSCWVVTEYLEDNTKHMQHYHQFTQSAAYSSLFIRSNALSELIFVPADVYRSLKISLLQSHDHSQTNPGCCFIHASILFIHRILVHFLLVTLLSRLLSHLCFSFFPIILRHFLLLLLFPLSSCSSSLSLSLSSPYPLLLFLCLPETRSAALFGHLADPTP